jgi:hypothetical protein
VPRRTGAVFVIALLAFWLLPAFALGPSSGGVELNSEPTASATSGPVPGQPAPCARVHEYQARGWGGQSLIRSDVWLTACTNASGQMRIATGPKCSASTTFGWSSANCSSAPDGSDVRVTLNVQYPFWVAWISGLPATLTFRIDPGGGYTSP